MQFDNTELNNYLSQILPQPSNTLKTDRFANELAGCNGECKSEGGCMTVSA